MLNVHVVFGRCLVCALSGLCALLFVLMIVRIRFVRMIVCAGGCLWA